MSGGAGAPVAAGAAQPWWQRGAIYQIYPRSFCDLSGDGVGDLAGIRSKLDHIASLGVSAVWPSPIFRSPMADFGYDVADYRDVDPLFGTLEELDALIAECHARRLRLLLDWVPSHTSDQHSWFAESRSSRSSAKRDWYVWRDAARGGGPPNDWVSAFPAVGGAWTWDEASGQWYLHSYLPQQPDLNWDNPEVEAAMHETLRFWLDRGVDGFRVDAIVKFAKDPELRSNAGADVRHDEDWRPTIHDRLRRVRAVVDEYEDRMIVGEVWVLDQARLADFLTADQFQLVHNFVFVQLGWDADAFRGALREWAAVADGWSSWFLANHDNPRPASRFDDGGHGEARARAIALMIHALRGTPFLYQGEELGLPGAEVPPERVVDVDGRDPERAPLPWRRPSVVGPGAGFTTGSPWLPLVADAERLCVEAQEEDPDSTLWLVRRVAALRASSPALRAGSQRVLDGAGEVLAWERELDGERWLCAVNFAAVEVAAGLPRGDAGGGAGAGGSAGPGDAELVLSSDPARALGPVAVGDLVLGPNEAALLRLR